MKGSLKMSEILNRLRASNSSLKLYSVLDSEFAPYGRVLPMADAAVFHRAMEATPIPETGNTYVADDAFLHAQDAILNVASLVFGGMPVETGSCNGHSFKLNALEYHKCSEVNFSSTGCVLLMALPDRIVGKTLRSEDVVGFYLPADVMIEVYPRTLHFAPCRIAESGFNCMVILEQGVNSPLECVDTSLEGEAGLLWMRGKWLIAHAESVPASKGAYVGIEGENLALNL